MVTTRYHITSTKGVPMEHNLTIKQIRGMLGLTQKEFAEKLEIKLSTYVNKENGRTEWSVKEIKTIMNLSQVPFDKIVV